MALKRLPEMTDERIKAAFGNPKLHVVRSKYELIAVLKQIEKRPLAAAFMSSGSFNGLTKEELEEVL